VEIRARRVTNNESMITAEEKLTIGLDRFKKGKKEKKRKKREKHTRRGVGGKTAERCGGGKKTKVAPRNKRKQKKIVETTHSKRKVRGMHTGPGRKNKSHRQKVRVKTLGQSQEKGANYFRGFCEQGKKAEESSHEKAAKEKGHDQLMGGENA